VKTIGEKHSINAVIGQTSYDDSYSWFSSGKKGMPDGIWSMSAGTKDAAASSSSSESTMTSYLGRLIYSYDNRYIFTGTYRRDGSSRFSKANRWGNFPSLSAAWNVANESFFKKLNTPISELKVRTSWGQLGNQEIGNYKYIASITSAISYGVGDPNTLWVGNIQTDLVPGNLKWETTTTSNLGLDLSFWNGRLNYTFDVFKKTTTDLLLQIPIPLSVGASSDPYGNAGKVQNNGFEMMLNYNGHHGDFKYSITGTLSHVKNEVKELSTGSQVLSGGSATHGGSSVTYTKEGFPMYSFFLIQTDGLFRSDAELLAHSKDGKPIQPNAQLGDVRFKDANDDGKIDGSDRVYCGSPFPKFEYGIRLEGSWKFIDASLFFQGSYGNKIYNGIRTYTESAIYSCNYSTELLNSYSFNTKSDIPRLDMADLNGNGVDNSDRYLEDGSYCRLKSMQIGFTLPDALTKKLTVSKCRFYIGADNLITWTKYKGYNPDIGRGLGERGIDFRQYPLNKSYHIGLQMNF
jgi:TonB-linked SusC/RagA family outer membrane protein